MIQKIIKRIFNKPKSIKHKDCHTSRYNEHRFKKLKVLEHVVFIDYDQFKITKVIDKLHNKKEGVYQTKLEEGYIKITRIS